MSRFTKNGSHLEAAPDIDAVGVQVGSLGSSGNAEIGSHLEAEDVAEGHAGQVGGSGSSEFTKNGSHLEAADFSNEPGAFL